MKIACAPSQRRNDFCCRTVAHAHPDNFRRRSGDKAQLAEIPILGIYDEAVFDCEVPDGAIIGLRHTDIDNMRRVGRVPRRGVGAEVIAVPVRVGRFLRNGKVTAEKIVEWAASGTASRVAGLDILAIQNTTSFRGDGPGNSFAGHATIAVEPEQGALPGLVDARIIERHGGGSRPRDGPCARP